MSMTQKCNASLSPVQRYIGGVIGLNAPFTCVPYKLLHYNVTQYFSAILLSQLKAAESLRSTDSVKITGHGLVIEELHSVLCLKGLLCCILEVHKHPGFYSKAFRKSHYQY
ncbi:hypothetical protein O6P43_017360 [Quillaja saponaria]|uniref:Uncharacterized protein n=1 Tax=Quillaja saponaria TaxID=32244 RepID=A0AAD7LPZ8_QUISA|nr:hypothetical protein O6P43_017360 [Quillaja saponaria]